MKQIFLILFCSFSCKSFGQTREVFISDTSQIDYSILENGDTLYNFLDIPRHGHWIAYFDVSKKRKAIEGDYIDGKEIGPGTKWESSLDSKFESTKETKWYSSGQIQFESIDSDIFIYDMTWWFPNGKIDNQRKCHNDTCTFEYYYPNGTLRYRGFETLDSTKSKIAFIGTWPYYDSTGKLKETVKYQDGKVVEVKEY
jgi:hypothetical protein